MEFSKKWLTTIILCGICYVGAIMITFSITRNLHDASVRFYTLINLILLRWIGFDGYTINYSKLHEQYTQVFLDEEPYRSV